jgi:DNA (cytosine-5)-methyltransferase 1
MRYLSVCSGIEAASVAFEPLGWSALAFAEIDPFPRAVLQHHYPRVPLYGDFTELRHQPWIVDADILVGGTPCQSFSVAGLRGSLSDDRGNLALEFIRLADAIDDLRRDAGRLPLIVLWENVPGVLSTDDNAFGAFLGGMVGSDAALVPAGRWDYAGVVDGPARVAAWRCLDAQHFGLAQRRKRVFVLAQRHPRGWACADALLPIIESLSGHPAPRREAGQRLAAGAGVGAAVSSGRGWWDDLDQGAFIPEIVPQAMSAKRAKGSSGPAGDEVANLVAHACVDVAPTMRAGGNRTGGDRPPGTDVDTCDSLIVAHSLRASGFDASEDGTGRGTPLVPVISHTLDTFSAGRCTEDGTGRGCPIVTTAHAYDARQSDLEQYGDMTGPLDTDGSTIPVMASLMAELGESTTARTYSATRTDSGVSSIGITSAGSEVTPATSWRRTPRRCESVAGRRS